MTNLADRIAIHERTCRGCGAGTEYPDQPWCRACLRRINGAYKPSAVTRMAADRRMPARALDRSAA